MKNKKRIKAYTILISVIFALGALGFIITRELISMGGGEGMRAYTASMGSFGWLFAVGLQVVQILVAFIPGELVESGLGFAFGPVYGTLYCYLGLAIGQAAVFLIIRRFGMSALRYFVSPEKLSGLRVFKGEERMARLTFILFLLPGTPKDLFCYLFPLTDISMGQFLLISLVARFPSVITSTLGGDMLAGGDIRSAVVLYAVTGTFSLLGMWVYNSVLKRRRLKFNV